MKNDIAIENFINFCDDMMIAEEGVLSKVISAIKKIGKAKKSTEKETGSKKKIPTSKESSKTQKISYVNKAVMDTYKYNGWSTNPTDYGNFKLELMTDDMYKKCKSVVDEFLSKISKFKKIVDDANKIAGGNYFTFIQESLTKYELTYGVDNSVYIVSYPIGYEFNNEVWQNKELNKKVLYAWDEMDKMIDKLCQDESIDCEMLKPNCDGYPEYCYDYHRFYMVEKSVRL